MVGDIYQLDCFVIFFGLGYVEIMCDVGFGIIVFFMVDDDVGCIVELGKVVYDGVVFVKGVVVC